MPSEGTPGRRSHRVRDVESSAQWPTSTDSLSDETLIAYVRGRLPEADAARIAAEATRRPDLAAEIALVRGLAGAADAEANAPVPGELGWARLSRALDAEPRAARPPCLGGASGPSRPRPLPPFSFGRWSRCRSSPARAAEARYAPVSEQPAAGSDRLGGLRADGERGSNPGAACGDGRADHRRAERYRPLATQLRRRRGPRCRTYPASGRGYRRERAGERVAPVRRS